MAERIETVNHPEHYNQHPSGVECIDIVEYMNFNLGNAVKYIWRASLKGDEVEQLQKAAWYIDREIERITRPARICLKHSVLSEPRIIMTGEQK